jgi:putative flippase GtrA
MRPLKPLARELSFAAGFAAVSAVGFLADYLALRLGLIAGLGSALARLISLGLAMQVTFALGRWLVFGRRDREGLGGEWWRFMVANAFGGVCNYLVFLALATARWPAGSGISINLILSSGVAYAINYAGARLFVFGRDLAIQPEKIGVGPCTATKG